MTEQPNRGQPNQQPPYPYAPPQGQAPGYQGPPPQQPQNPYGQQQPYPQQQHGAPQQQAYPQQQYPQVPPQQYAGQQPPGWLQGQGQPQFPGPQQFQGQQPYPAQQFPGQPGQQFPGQSFPGQPGQEQNPPKPKKKRSGWATFFIVLFSPFIALAFVAFAVYWVLCWLLTPVALVVHFVLCGLGLIWFSLVKALASGGSKYRLFQPMYPKFPQLWTGPYWVRLNRNVRNTFEGLAAVAQLLDW